MLTTVVWLCIVLSVLYVGYTAYENTKKVNINRVEVSPHDTLGRNKINVLHLSDLHLENISISPNHLYEWLKGESVDLIAITGDFLDRKRSIPKLAPYLETLNKLQPIHGIYAVFGNHDYVLSGKNLADLKKTLTHYNCRILQNEALSINVNGHPLNIIGVDDYSTNRSDLTASYSRLKIGYDLVLTHDPNIVLDMKGYSFDFLLSGHFHGGQLLYPKPYHLVKMGKLPKMNMIKGLHHYQGKPFYISEGLGQTGLNIRIGSRPEITLHTLTVEKTACVMNDKEIS